jgi:hypothetical protein
LNLYFLGKCRIVSVQLLSNTLEQLLVTCIVVDWLVLWHFRLFLLYWFLGFLLLIELYDVKLNEFLYTSSKASPSFGYCIY